MKAHFTSFQIPKKGNTDVECEDAVKPFVPGEGMMSEFRHQTAAIADGATEGMLSGDWARILTETFCTLDYDPEIYPIDSADIRQSVADGFFETVKEQWEVYRKEYLLYRDTTGKPLEWFEEPGFEAGAYSTFLGIDFSENRGKNTCSWFAVGAGDSCLFQLRKGKVLAQFPAMTTDHFTQRPKLVSSRFESQKALRQAGVYELAHGDCQPGDVFFLMTDALALWVLHEIHSKVSPFARLWELLKAGKNSLLAFSEFVTGLRQAGSIKNDDVTLLVIQIL